MAAITTRPVASPRLLDVLHDAVLGLAVSTVFALGAVLLASTLAGFNQESPALWESDPRPSAQIAPEPRTAD